MKNILFNHLFIYQNTGEKPADQSKVPTYMDEVNKKPQPVAIKEKQDLVVKAEVIKLVDRKDKFINKINSALKSFNAEAAARFVGFENIVNDIFYKADTIEKQQKLLDVLEESFLKIQEFMLKAKEGAKQLEEIDVKQMYREFKNSIDMKIQVLGISIDSKIIDTIAGGIWVCGASLVLLSAGAEGTKDVAIVGAAVMAVGMILLGALALKDFVTPKLYHSGGNIQKLFLRGENIQQNVYDIVNDYLDKNAAESPEMKDFLLTLASLTGKSGDMDVKPFLEDIMSLKTQCIKSDNEIDRKELAKITTYIKEKYLA